MMFRSALWRNDKNKFRASFKLEFHATQVTQLNGEKLMVSVVPSDVGKPIVRLEKAAVADGKCQWENAAYETVKFGREPKSGRLTERICQFIVSAESGKGGFVGEASVDLADYAETTKGCSVALPLKNSGGDAILHIFIRRLAEHGGRGAEENKDSKVITPDRSSRTRFSNGNIDESDRSVTSSSAEDHRVNETSLNAEANGIRRASSGSDITVTSSESSSSEMNTPRENGVGNSIIVRRDHGNLLSSMSRLSLPNMRTTHESMPPFEEESGERRWGSFSSFDRVSVTDLHGTDTKEGLGKSVDGEIKRLRAELAATARQANFSNLELQTLRKQIVKECKRSQDLSREIVGLKEERDALRNRIEEAGPKNEMQFDGGGDMRALLAEVRQELNFEKNTNADLRIQLQKTQESNAELMLAVKDLDEMLLLQKNHEVCARCNHLASSENHDRSIERLSRSETDDDEEQKALEELVKEHRDAKEAYLLEQRILDLSSEIEIYRRDRDELEMQMEQLALDYEILKQKSHEMSVKLEQNQLQEQLKLPYEALPVANLNELQVKIECLESKLADRSKECSDSVAMVRELEARIKILEDELEKKGEEFVSDLEIVTRAKVEQERRAIRTEEALANLRWKNADIAERLQEELRRLFEQMASTFNANEKLAMRSSAEASDLLVQKGRLEEMLRKANEELHAVRNAYEQNLSQEKNRLPENALASMKKQLKDSLRELKHVRESKDECDRTIASLRLEIRTARVELNDSKNSLIQCEIEKDYLQAQVFRLKRDIKRKNEEMKGVEDKFKECDGRTVESNGGKESGFDSVASVTCSSGDTAFRENEAASDKPNGENEPAGIDSISERNKSMEAELKELQEKYSEMSLKFAVVEGERQRLVMSLRNIKNSKN